MSDPADDWVRAYRLVHAKRSPLRSYFLDFGLPLLVVALGLGLILGTVLGWVLG